MKKEFKYSLTIIIPTILWTLLLVYALQYFNIRIFASIKPDVNEIFTLSNTWNVSSWDVKYISTGSLVSSWTVISWDNITINKDCTFDNNTYNSVFIADYDNIIHTPSNPWDVKPYTKNIAIEWKVTSAYICIISDVRADYKKYKAYYFDTYIRLDSIYYAGHLNVGYNTAKSLVYDNSTDTNNKFLDGKFYWHETPFVQVINLEKVVVWDSQYWWYKMISPKKLFKPGAVFRVGGYVNSYPNYWAGKIIMYKIIYKWWKIKIVD